MIKDKNICLKVKILYIDITAIVLEYVYNVILNTTVVRIDRIEGVLSIAIARRESVIFQVIFTTFHDQTSSGCV